MRFHIPEILSQGGVNSPYAVDFYFSLWIGTDPFENEITPVGGHLLASGVNIGNSPQTVDYVVDLEALGIACRPCGNIWEILFGYGAIGNVMELSGQMTLEIVDVTY